MGVLGDTWLILPDSYLNKAITNVEERFGPLKTVFGWSTNNSHAPINFHPELDSNKFLGTDVTQLYQSYVGILRWAVELG